jgi:hypothetical protein
MTRIARIALWPLLATPDIGELAVEPDGSGHVGRDKTKFNNIEKTGHEDPLAVESTRLLGHPAAKDCHMI